ncbi:MAG: sodium:alanine symporter family protein, partial [Acidobacteria bacterium]|nr:sodium:alanine symporter family protein [Acidobacteriota bacterium]
TKDAEAVLGVHCRVRRDTGERASGPMYYITGGIPSPALGKSLGYAFAFFGACTALFGTGNMVQSNTVARTFVEAARSNAGLEVPQIVPGLLITVLVGLVLLGGIRRIAAVAERIVPAMIVLYVAMAGLFLLMNIGQVPHVLGLIFGGAFTPSGPVGGVAGRPMGLGVGG